MDAQGLSVAVDTMSAQPHESQLVQRLFDFMLTEKKRVIGDRAYDSDKLDAELAEQGVELIAPHKYNRKPENKTQDGRPLRRYKRRWTVERSISWIQNFRRLCIRWETSTKLFQGFLHLGCTVLLLRAVLGQPLDKQSYKGRPVNYGLAMCGPVFSSPCGHPRSSRCGGRGLFPSASQKRSASICVQARLKASLNGWLEQ